MSPSVVDVEKEEKTRTQFVVEEDACIACGLCHERAPGNIELDEAEMYARVVRQPTNDAEEAACKEASEYCPTGGLRPVKARDT